MDHQEEVVYLANRQRGRDAAVRERVTGHLISQESVSIFKDSSTSDWQPGYWEGYQEELSGSRSCCLAVTEPAAEAA